MDQLSAVMITKALDGLAMRQSFLAQNIANAGSVDYSPISVSFEEALLAASKQGMSAVEGTSPLVVMSNGSDGTTDTELRLDMQLAESSKTALRYSALVEVLSRHMGLTRSALGGGSR